MTGFASLVLDVDSTIAGIEGIDWLAQRRGPETAKRVGELTDRAMRGEIELDAVFGERLKLVAPSRDEVGALAKAYVAAIAPGARKAILALLELGKRIALVSGGLRPAIAPLAATLGIAPGWLCAVDVRFDGTGKYAGFDESSPLTTSRGKAEIVRAMALPRPIVLVGDGATDLAARPAVDCFVAYTGFVRRDPVIAKADLVAENFGRVLDIVRG